MRRGVPQQTLEGAAFLKLKGEGCSTVGVVASSASRPWWRRRAGSLPSYLLHHPHVRVATRVDVVTGSIAID
jgi:hypothetical protein